MKRIFPILLLLCAQHYLRVSTQAAETARLNVLFIAVDDLNHWVGHIGRNAQAFTPNIDRLARSGVAFTHAYCSAPVCNASRASLLSGLRPSTTGCYDNTQNWRAAISEDKLLNSHFIRAGYLVYGAGKIYHGEADRGGDWTDYFDDAHRTAKLKKIVTAAGDGVGLIKFCPLDNADEDMPDHSIVSYGLERLKEKHEKPFFLAVGLHKPHMPFNVPKKWFDLFPLDSIQLPPHREDDLDDVPSQGKKLAEVKHHKLMLESGRWKEAVQAYLAAVAFMDAQVGHLLDGLEASAYRDNTIVCLWSDHGWSLGEKSHWRKFALWEEPTRSVLVWKVPSLTPDGGVCSRTVDFTAIYPTLCSLTGLPLPAHLEGSDLTTLLKNPQAPWDAPALTTAGFQNHTLRSQNWRYIRYANGEEELYDETADPLEHTNLASRPEHTATKAALAIYLPKINVPALPTTSNGGEAESPTKKAPAK
jgi:arylsulfatase A-like enzyme